MFAIEATICPSPSARGLGVGRRIFEALETQAREIGLKTLRLETNDALKEAQALVRLFRIGYPWQPAACQLGSSRSGLSSGYEIQG